jgi:hypothetical protein
MAGHTIQLEATPTSKGGRKKRGALGLQPRRPQIPSAKIFQPSRTIVSTFRKASKPRPGVEITSVNAVLFRRSFAPQGVEEGRFLGGSCRISRCKLTIEHYPSGSMVTRVFLTANPAVYTKTFSQPIAGAGPRVSGNVRRLRSGQTGIHFARFPKCVRRIRPPGSVVLLAPMPQNFHHPQALSGRCGRFMQVLY